MSHILVQNKGELPLWGMRLMGLSDKREDQIGRFGTGLKESIALLMRKGLPPVIFSGTCRIDFESMDLDGMGHYEICFRLSEPRPRFRPDEWHPLGMSVNLGKHDWDDCWMVFREIVCNALDEGGKDNLFHDVVTNEPVGIEGSTRIYVPLTPETVSAYGLISERILSLHKSEELFSSPRGRVLKKHRKGPVQVFHKGVWVQEAAADAASLFDYEIFGLKLNESRSADWYNAYSEIALCLAAAPTEYATTMIDRTIRGKEQYFEQTMFQRASYFLDVQNGELWRDAFVSLYTPDAVLCRNESFSFQKIREKGLTPVICPNEGLYTMLVACGVRDIAQLVTTLDTRFSETYAPNQATQKNFDKVWQAFRKQQAIKPRLMVMVSNDPTIRGSYDNNTCYISSAVIGCELEMEVHVEEIAHHLSGCGDCSREFQTYLIRCLTQEFMKF